ncbi:MAG: cell division protein FtsK [Legionellales bacterium]|nr:cell division protein FtsK [Legionellales bacterium]
MSASSRISRWKSSTFYEQLNLRLKEGLLILSAALGLFLTLSLITFSEADPGWSKVGVQGDISNAGGHTGAWFADVLFSLSGIVSYLLPIAIIYSGFVLYRGPSVQSLNEQTPKTKLWVLRVLGFMFALLASCALAGMHLKSNIMPMGAGGYLGAALAYFMVGQFSVTGATVLLVSIFLVGITFLTGLSWIDISEKVGFYSLALLKKTGIWIAKTAPEVAQKIKSKPLPDFPKLLPPEKAPPTIIRHEPSRSTKPSPKPATSPIRSVVKPNKAVATSVFKVSNDPNAPAPSLGLLDSTETTSDHGFTERQLEELSALVEKRLEEFGLTVTVVAVHPGPVITRFELSLAPGLKVSRVTNLAKDLARALSVVSVRVVEVIPGKSVVGLEIPNVDREVVRLKAVLEDESYQHAPSPLTLALGKDISGKPVTADLTKMPHLLVAGTTGAGKSVALNAMLLSVLYKSTPDDVRMILIDPKMLELAVYDDIPHLLTPVVTDMKEASNALRWCVNEMERRYQLMAALGVRHLSGYNKKVSEAIKKGMPIDDPLWVPQEGETPPKLERLPYILVLVDEFADMMMVVGKKVEELIARIAQKARAAGIHLILATQRPSVDVITGLIKANIPTRIAFQVSSKIDSRTIIDQSGAEQLLGHGDMLYLPPGVGIPNRIHGAFVSDEEVHNVAKEWRSRGKPQYIESIITTNTIQTRLSNGDDEDVDDLYDEAVFVVTESRRPSISHVQRRLKIGYNRAARLIEKMEEEGIVSPIQANGSREVLAPPPVEN